MSQLIDDKDYRFDIEWANLENLKINGINIEPMRRNGQACSKCGKYLGMATGKARICKKCKG